MIGWGATRLAHAGLGVAEDKDMSLLFQRRNRTKTLGLMGRKRKLYMKGIISAIWIFISSGGWTCPYRRRASAIPFQSLTRICYALTNYRADMRQLTHVNLGGLPGQYLMLTPLHTRSWLIIHGDNVVFLHLKEQKLKEYIKYLL